MYSRREIDIHIKALEHARRLVIKTGKGVIASNAITQEIQKMNLQKQVAIMKGRL